eukprot:9725833-Alexandrium_andersonii.AAC.1
MEVSLPDVDEEGLSGPAPATASAAPAPGCQVRQEESKSLKGRSRCKQGVILVIGAIFGDVATPHVGRLRLPLVVVDPPAADGPLA